MATVTMDNGCVLVLTSDREENVETKIAAVALPLNNVSTPVCVKM